MWSLKWGKSKSECKWQLFAHSFFHWSISPPVKYTDCESWWCWISLHEALTAWGWDSNWAWMGSSCTFVEVSPSPTTSRYLTLWGGRRPLGSAKTAATASQCAYLDSGTVSLFALTSDLTNLTIRNKNQRTLIVRRAGLSSRNSRSCNFIALLLDFIWSNYDYCFVISPLSWISFEAIMIIALLYLLWSVLISNS